MPAKSQASVLPPIASQIPTDLGLKFIPDLKKKRPIESLEEGEVGSHQGSKQQKTTWDYRDRRALSVESRKEMERAEVHVPHQTWSPRLEVDRAAIPYNASVLEYNRDRVGYIAEALEQPVLLPRDMEVYRQFSQPELFLSLKRDLAMVRQFIFSLVRSLDRIIF